MAKAPTQRTKGDTLLTTLETKDKGLLNKLLSIKGRHPMINKQERGVFPLEYALHENEIDFVEVLLDGGAKDTFLDKNGHSAIHIACITKVDTLAKIKLLVQRNRTNVNRRNAHSSTPLILACIAKNTDAVQFLIEEGAELDARDNAGQTLLNRAAYYNLPEIIRIAMHYLANINEKDPKNGNTPLHIAAHFASFQAVEAFTSNPNCDIKARNKANKTALDIARSEPVSTVKGYDKIVEHISNLNTKQYKITLQWNGLEKEWQLFSEHSKHIKGTALEKLATEMQNVQKKMTENSNCSNEEIILEIKRLADSIQELTAKVISLEQNPNEPRVIDLREKESEYEGESLNISLNVRIL